jgi:hypothetical protein
MLIGHLNYEGKITPDMKKKIDEQLIFSIDEKNNIIKYNEELGDILESDSYLDEIIQLISTMKDDNISMTGTFTFQEYYQHVPHFAIYSIVDNDLNVYTTTDILYIVEDLHTLHKKNNQSINNKRVERHDKTFKKFTNKRTKY